MFTEISAKTVWIRKVPKLISDPVKLSAASIKGIVREMTLPAILRILPDDSFRTFLIYEK